MKFKGDIGFLVATLILSVVGFLIFASASMGLLARNDVSFSGIAFNQLIFGLFGGFGALFITYRIPVTFWRRNAFYVFLATLLLSALVFVPGLGFSHAGATRWIDLGFITFQPAELLKLGAIIYTAAWFSGIKRKAGSFLHGFVPVFVIILLCGGLLLLQPDTDTFVIIAMTVVLVWFVAGAKLKYIGLLILLGLFTLTAVAFTRPYIMDRLMTFADPSRDSLGSSYQIQQSLIAIGSGGLAGRGFGQSIQKYNFLPEPIGDSIFAVAAEEFGLLGSVLIIGFFILFVFKGLKIATKSTDSFSRLLVVGIVILIIVQSFMNISAMLNIIPLVGTPLLFVSHGGTALFVVLAEAGIILSASKKNIRKK